MVFVDNLEKQKGKMMSIWMKKDGQTVSIVPVTDFVAMCIAVFLGWIAGTITEHFGTTEQGQFVLVVVGIIVFFPMAYCGRIWMIKKLKEDGYE